MDPLFAILDAALLTMLVLALLIVQRLFGWVVLMGAVLAVAAAFALLAYLITAATTQGFGA